MFFLGGGGGLNWHGGDFSSFWGKISGGGGVGVSHPARRVFTSRD